jgi:hypothetical protein
MNMEKEQAKEILGYATEALSFPGASLAAWSAIYNDNVHFHIRADLLFLNIIENRQGLIRYYRIRPALIQKGRTGGAELLYAKRDLVRITRGTRKGRVLPIDLLKSHEPYVPSGLCKKLEYRTDSDCFHVKRKGDIACLELMQTMLTSKEAPAVKSLADMAPELHLIARMGTEKLISRRNGSTASWIRERMQEGEDMQEAATRIANGCAQDAGPGMVSYPFEHFYGKGVVGARIDSPAMHFGEWYSFRSGIGSKPGIVFDC